jgi:4a-hydroxytetrahydrobiopterin dehydratase
MTKPALLSSDQIRDKLQMHPTWTLQGKEIQKKFHFRDFGEAIRFVNRVAAEAEKADHHPDIVIQYDKVTLTISTHSAGGLTEKDFTLARDIDFI